MHTRFISDFVQVGTPVRVDLHGSLSHRLLPSGWPVSGQYRPSNPVKIDLQQVLMSQIGCSEVGGCGLNAFDRRCERCKLAVRAETDDICSKGVVETVVETAAADADEDAVEGLADDALEVPVAGEGVLKALLEDDGVAADASESEGAIVGEGADPVESADASESEGADPVEVEAGDEDSVEVEAESEVEIADEGEGVG